jgi:hypothetical protein
MWRRRKIKTELTLTAMQQQKYNTKFKMKSRNISSATPDILQTLLLIIMFSRCSRTDWNIDEAFFLSEELSDCEEVACSK